MFRALSTKLDWLPFALNILFSLISAVYILAGFWPYIVPPNMTIYNAGSPAYGNAVLLTSAYVIIPVIVAYLVYSYIIFRGKVTGQNHYEPTEAAQTRLLRSANKASGIASENPVQLPWWIRLAISLTGWIFFFIVLGFLGNRSALAAIFIFIALFVIAWWLSSKKMSARPKIRRIK